METSAKASINVEEAFFTLASDIKAKMEKRMVMDYGLHLRLKFINAEYKWFGFSKILGLKNFDLFDLSEWIELIIAATYMDHMLIWYFMGIISSTNLSLLCNVIDSCVFHLTEIKKNLTNSTLR